MSLLRKALKCEVLWVQMHFLDRALTEKGNGAPDDISMVADCFLGSRMTLSFLSFLFKELSGCDNTWQGDGEEGGQGLAGCQVVWGLRALLSLSGMGLKRERTGDRMLPSEVKSLNLDLIVKRSPIWCGVWEKWVGRGQGGVVSQFDTAMLHPGSAFWQLSELVWGLSHFCRLGIPRLPVPRGKAELYWFLNLCPCHYRRHYPYNDYHHGLHYYYQGVVSKYTNTPPLEVSVQPLMTLFSWNPLSPHKVPLTKELCSLIIVDRI